jgi:hypothetical protein
MKLAKFNLWKRQTSDPSSEHPSGELRTPFLRRSSKRRAIPITLSKGATSMTAWRHSPFRLSLSMRLYTDSLYQLRLSINMKRADIPGIP